MLSTVVKADEIIQGRYDSMVVRQKRRMFQMAVEVEKDMHICVMVQPIK